VLQRQESSSSVAGRRGRRSVAPLSIVALLAGAFIAFPGAARAQASSGATKPSFSATCKDGTKWTGATRKGACTGHGGVKSWSDRSSAPRPKGATAQCNDGSWYTKTERRGACAGHGGVKQWVSEAPR